LSHPLRDTCPLSQLLILPLSPPSLLFSSHLTLLFPFPSFSSFFDETQIQEFWVDDPRTSSKFLSPPRSLPFLMVVGYFAWSFQSENYFCLLPTCNPNSPCAFRRFYRFLHIAIQYNINIFVNRLPKFPLSRSCCLRPTIPPRRISFLVAVHQATCPDASPMCYLSLLSRPPVTMHPLWVFPKA